MKNLRKIGGFIECLTDYVSQFYADLSAPHPSEKLWDGALLINSVAKSLERSQIFIRELSKANARPKEFERIPTAIEHVNKWSTYFLHTCKSLSR
jgi:hypothetical protein